MRIYLSLFIALLSLSVASAQELKFKVNITNTSKNQIVDPKVYQSMRVAIEEFLNNTKWTDDVFEQEERINGSIQLTITEETSPNSFKADLMIQSARPIYGTVNETPLLNHNDRGIVFGYEQFQPLQFSRNVFTDNLTAILSFYAHIILGMDYDSFALNGGEPYFQLAQEILNNVPQGIDGGWSSSTNRSRYQMIQNILAPSSRDLRKAMYDYHRQGLDVMHKDVAGGRAIVAKAIQMIGNIGNANQQNAMIVQMFANAKSLEIVEIFKVGTFQEKQNILQIMQRLDPANASKYRDITNPKPNN